MLYQYQSDTAMAHMEPEEAEERVEEGQEQLLDVRSRISAFQAKIEANHKIHHFKPIAKESKIRRMEDGSLFSNLEVELLLRFTKKSILLMLSCV